MQDLGLSVDALWAQADALREDGQPSRGTSLTVRLEEVEGLLRNA